MPRIDLRRTVSCPQRALAPRLLTVLEGYAARSDIVLTVDVGVAGAAMSVPVDVAIGDAATRAPEAIPVVLKALRRSAWFPVFHGEIRNEPGGPLESSLHLDGTYETPLGPIGTIADRTILGHAAERSLKAFLERLSTDVLVEVRRAELAIRTQTRIER
jgi:hypothetical protein